MRSSAWFTYFPARTQLLTITDNSGFSPDSMVFAKSNEAPDVDVWFLFLPDSPIARSAPFWTASTNSLLSCVLVKEKARFLFPKPCLLGMMIIPTNQRAQHKICLWMGNHILCSGVPFNLTTVSKNTYWFSGVFSDPKPLHTSLQ